MQLGIRKVQELLQTTAHAGQISTWAFSKDQNTQTANEPNLQEIFRGQGLGRNVAQRVR